MVAENDDQSVVGSHPHQNNEVNPMILPIQLALQFFLVISVHEGCGYNFIDWSDRDNLKCLKHDQATRKMKALVRDHKVGNLQEGQNLSELFQRDFLVVGTLHFEPQRYEVIILFKGKPALYSAHIDLIGSCAYKLSNFEEVAVEPDGPDFLKKQMPRLLKLTGLWQNAFTDPKDDSSEDACGES